jgi:hypothetical protein
VQFQLHAGFPLLIGHLEEIDLGHGTGNIQQCVDSPKALKRSVDHNFGCFNLAQVERKRSGSAPAFWTASATSSSAFGLRSQYNGGKIASQSDSGGTSDALASSSHNCDRITHENPPLLPCRADWSLAHRLINEAIGHSRLSSP